MLRHLLVALVGGGILVPCQLFGSSTPSERITIPGRRFTPAILLEQIGAALGSNDQVPRPDSVRHPLDPLTAAEYAAVPAALVEAGYVEEFRGLYPFVTLEEPPKADVLAWRPGEPIPRHAFAVVKVDDAVFEAVVNVTSGSVVSWTRVEGVQPGILLSEEWSFATRIVPGNPAFREALAKRGITSLQHVVCVPNTVGYYGTPEEEGRRIVKVVCYFSEDTKNFWGRPIEGLLALVDLENGQVVRIVDTGVRPIPVGPVDFDSASVGEWRKPTNPIAMIQPRGASFAVDGHVVQWQKWHFHFRVDPRLGLIISTVRYDDDGTSRSILYQGSLSEIFVPYMDPDVGWYWRSFLDAGEYGVGKLTVRLVPDKDCPSDARFFDAVFMDDWGDPYPQERAACLFERYAGDIAWRHSEAVTGETEVRRRIELVLRSISAVGNYDYVFDWVFRQDGSIDVQVGATGIPVVKGVDSRNVTHSQADADTRYGRMVAEHTVAVNHDHFLSFRLDLDVDGSQNSFVVDRLRTTRTDGSTPRSSLWTVDSRTAFTEQAAKLRIDLERPALWRVINPNVTGPLGYPVSYQLHPRANAVSLLAPDDRPQQRTGFTDAHLWVTPYASQERYAAGMYPNQSRGGDGLPRWTGADRPIENTDLVVWYTLGLHHVVRAEDWPVMPTTSGGFELRPFDFFRRNPALDLPR